MWDDVDDSEAGEYADLPEQRPSMAEIKAAAEIVVFLEHEMGLDVSRLRVRVRENIVFIQGSVDTREQREEIEKAVPTRPNVQSLVCAISVNYFK